MESVLFPGLLWVVLRATCDHVNTDSVTRQRLFTENVYYFLKDWKALREQAGMTLEQLAKKSGWSPAAINGLELRGEGSQRLKDKLAELLLPAEVTVAVNITGSESVISRGDRLVDALDNITLEQWRQRAIFYEERLNQLQSNLRSALQLSDVPPPAFSSKPVSAAARYGAKASTSSKSDPAK